jgi:ribosomal protein L16 Arg81 hydroxylase
MDFTLNRILRPMPLDTFFLDYWQRQPLIVARGEPGYFEGLLALRDVDTMIYFGRPAFASAAVAEPGAVRIDSVVKGNLPGTRPTEVAAPDLAGLSRMYVGGKTVYVHNVERFWRPVAELCRHLEAALHYPADAGLFLTPQGAQGLPLHYDNEDVLVLQIEGSKHWRVYAPVEPLPLEPRMLTEPREQLGAPLHEVRLDAGDVLYMPRGFIHEAFTADTYSLHVTVGIKVFRWADLLAQALASVSRQDARLREALPPGFLGAGMPHTLLEERFRELLMALASEAPFQEALRRLGDEFFAGLPALPDQRFADPDAVSINLDTILEKRPELFCRVVEEEDAASIQYPGNQIRGPRRIAAELYFIAGAGQFSARSMPSTLSDDSKLLLLGRLVKEKLLRIAVPE